MDPCAKEDEPRAPAADAAALAAAQEPHAGDYMQHGRFIWLTHTQKLHRPPLFTRQNYPAQSPQIQISQHSADTVASADPACVFIMIRTSYGSFQLDTKVDFRFPGIELAS